MRRAHAGVVHRTVKYHSAVTPIDSRAISFDWTFPFACTGTCSLELEIFCRRLPAITYNFELDLLALIERGETRTLDSRYMDKHVLPATLRLDEPVAFGRIKPLHCSGRHNDLQAIE